MRKQKQKILILKDFDNRNHGNTKHRKRKNDTKFWRLKQKTKRKRNCSELNAWKIKRPLSTDCNYFNAMTSSRKASTQLKTESEQNWRRAIVIHSESDICRCRIAWHARFRSRLDRMNSFRDVARPGLRPDDWPESRRSNASSGKRAVSCADAGSCLWFVDSLTLADEGVRVWSDWPTSIQLAISFIWDEWSKLAETPPTEQLASEAKNNRIIKVYRISNLKSDPKTNWHSDTCIQIPNHLPTLVVKQICCIQNHKIGFKIPNAP